jgi:acyl-CoA reductase-like NAD-dependent aldehyde dehydrogenase
LAVTGSVEHFPLMIPGGTSASDPITVTAPYDGTAIATVATTDGGAVETALANAYALFVDRDQWLSVPKRIEILEGTIEILAADADYYAVEAAREGGKPLIDSQVEVARAIDSLKLCIETLRTEGGTAIPMGINPASVNRLAVTRHEPIGVVVAVSAFNHPLNLIAHQVGPAVAAGCPVLIKPAGDTPLSCLRLVQALRKAGLPDAWCQPTVTATRDVATDLVTDPRVAFFSFIGSADVGWRLRTQLSPGTRAALEHGGAAPVILAADADMDVAMPAILKGGFYHAGQVCVSVQRVFAHESIARGFAEALAGEAVKLVVGDPIEATTEVGPLIRPREVDRVAAWVDEARDGGADVLCGGAPVSETCYAPTVLFDPPADANVSGREIFGPVVCVYPYKDIDDAIAKANSLAYAFQASVFTRDMETAMRAYARLDATAVMVNDHTAFRVDWMPFAGLRQSGLGVGGIPHTMHEMQIEKMLVIKSAEL